MTEIKQKVFVYVHHDHNLHIGSYVLEMLRQAREYYDRIVIVTNLPEAKTAPFGVFCQSGDLYCECADTLYPGNGLKHAVVTMSQELKTFDSLSFSHSNVFGFFQPLSACYSRMDQKACDFWSVYEFQEASPGRFGGEDPGHHFQWDFLHISAKVLASDEFFSFWNKLECVQDYASSVMKQEAAFSTAMQAAGFVGGGFFDDHEQFVSAEPGVFELDQAVKFGAPVVKRQPFFFDPFINEFEGIYLDRCFNEIQSRTAFDVSLIWKDLLRGSSLRNIHSNVGELSIFHEKMDCSQLQQLQSGQRIAVIAHVFYVEALGEIMAAVQNLAAPYDLLITTSTQGRATHIASVLNDSGMQAADIRVVEQNRGRDMSSLFITWRDVMMSGQYEIALRLHSKKTPQVSPQMGRNFRDHLYENLVASKDYSAQVIDLLLRQPTIGMIVPSTIHIGFGTLGHAWFANRPNCESAAQRLGLSVPFDEVTPVAAYGTMFYFRPKALQKMFAEPWRWDEFNAEPFHVDGGLAHVMERLMSYVCQDAGFRVHSILTSNNAARNYVKLEYKYQKLAGLFPTGDVRDQVALASQVFAANNVGLGYTLYLLLYKLAKQMLPERLIFGRLRSANRWLRQKLS